MKFGGAIYIMTNTNHTTFYIGVTSDLRKRIFEHKTNFCPESFTTRYKLHKLVYFEGFHRIEDAISREKQLKAGSRKRKIDLIYSFNPEWKDLSDNL